MLGLANDQSVNTDPHWKQWSGLTVPHGGAMVNKKHISETEYYCKKIRRRNTAIDIEKIDQI